MSETQNATPAETLEQRIMDPCVPKSETEWWAHREIAKQRAEIERLRAERDEARDESNPVQEPVAWRNKKWGYFTVNPIASKHPDWEPLYTAQRTRQLRKTLEGKP